MSHPTRPAAKSLAELLSGTLDPVLRKRGLARSEILSWWPEIVGEAYARQTAPERIRWPRDGGAATLFVRCDPALALQFAHEVDRVRERLNGYFGYPAVAIVRIVQQRVGTGPRASQPQPELENVVAEGLEARLDGLDEPIKESLRMLGRVMLARS